MNKTCKGCGNWTVTFQAIFLDNFIGKKGTIASEWLLLDQITLKHTSLPIIVCDNCSRTGPQTGWRFEHDITIQEWEVQKALGTLPPLTLVKIED